MFAPKRIEAAVAAILPQAVGGDAHRVGRLRVDILSVVNRARDTEDRVVVRVRAHVDGGRPAGGTEIHERWTLVRHGARWRLATASGDPLSASLLSSPLVTSAQDDDARLREASLQELTSSRRGGPGPGELTDDDVPPPHQLRDLSVADERFEPMLIEAALTHIVEAWEQSSDGSDAPLLAVATGAGAHALTFPTPGHGRRRMHDARVQRWEVTGVDASARPPRVEVRVRVSAAVSESESDQGHAGHLDLAWMLALDETTHTRPRWRLTHSADAS